jgi:hypothetical protein
MGAEKRLITTIYDRSQKEDLLKFCSSCDLAGYANNRSLQSMKLDWCLDLGGAFYTSRLENEIISVSGCHPLKEVGSDVYRILFRGAELPQYKNYHGIMSKTHMGSIPFFYHVPLQIKYGQEVGYKRFVITTNWTNSISSMEKSHRVFNLLERQGLVTKLVDKMMLFYTEQSVWELDLDMYFKLRTEFKDRHGL